MINHCKGDPTMTIVNRRTFIAKPGHLDEVVKMLKGDEGNLVQRVYRSHYGTFNVAVLEVEFNSVAEMEDLWTGWFQSDAAQKFHQRWNEITEPGGTNEVWILE
jgi:hypothetical protein